MTLNIYFEDGFHGILTNRNPQKIREWLAFFSRPEVMADCRIVSVDVGNRNPLKEAV